MIDRILAWSIQYRFVLLAFAAFIIGGGIYAATTGDNLSGFGPELDSTGTVIDPNRGANRYALSAGFNYSINANAAWKTEVRVDRSTGYNFLDPKTGAFKRSNVLLGTAVVVSF